ARGYFEQVFHRQQYALEGLELDFVQDNFSSSQKGVLRGLHYQLKTPQAKLVTVFYGSVFDVVVDLRRSSKNFGKWLGVELSAENGRQLFVPRGFAHGFLVTSETVGFFYKCDAFYDPEDEHTILWNDPSVGINWPLQGSPELSAKDRDAPLLSQIPAEKLFS
ncbi:MAG: dTDP-4-dehydrorhamnose 3,5-epimerase, partial [Pseudomonadales bacterium]